MGLGWEGPYNSKVFHNALYNWILEADLGSKILLQLHYYNRAGPPTLPYKFYGNRLAGWGGELGSSG